MKEILGRILPELESDPAWAGAIAFREGYTIAQFWLELSKLIPEDEWKRLFTLWADDLLKREDQ